MLPLGLFVAVMLMTLAGLDDPVGLKAASGQRSQDLVLRIARPFMTVPRPDGTGSRIIGQKDVVVIAVDADADGVRLTADGWPTSWPLTYDEWTALLTGLAALRPRAIFIDAYFTVDMEARFARLPHGRVSTAMRRFADTAARLCPPVSAGETVYPIPVSVGCPVVGERAEQALPSAAIVDLFRGADVIGPTGVSTITGPGTGPGRIGVPAVPISFPDGPGLPLRRSAAGAATAAGRCWGPPAEPLLDRPCGRPVQNTGHSIWDRAPVGLHDLGPAAWAYVHHRCGALTLASSRADCRRQVVGAMGWDDPDRTAPIQVTWPLYMDQSATLQAMGTRSDPASGACVAVPSLILPVDHRLMRRYGAHPGPSAASAVAQALGRTVVLLPGRDTRAYAALARRGARHGRGVPMEVRDAIAIAADAVTPDWVSPRKPAAHRHRTPVQPAWPMTWIDKAVAGYRAVDTLFTPAGRMAGKPRVPPRMVEPSDPARQLLCPGIPGIRLGDLVAFTAFGGATPDVTGDLRRMIEDRVVMIGRATASADLHAVDDKVALPGVYVHAAALRGLIEDGARYLRVLKPEWRWPATATDVCAIPGRGYEVLLGCLSLYFGFRIYRGRRADDTLAMRIVKHSLAWVVMAGLVALSVWLLMAVCREAPLNWIGVVSVSGLTAGYFIRREWHQLTRTDPEDA